MRNEKILILYSNYGDGHQQAAKAICDTLTRTHPNMEGILVDFMELTHPHVHPISRYCFIQGVKKFPSAYGFLFKQSRNENLFSSILKKINGLGLGRLVKLIQKTSPSMVVSTFPLAAGAMSKLKVYGLINVPTTTIITDHTDHSSWIYPCTDHYIVGSDFVKQALQSYDTPSHQISVTGIPIRKEFNQSYSRIKLVQKHNLDPALPILLLMSGGYGFLGDGASLLKALDELPQIVQILIVCGRNQQLERVLLDKVSQSKHNVHIKGYIDYVHEFMVIADLMVTKPGGLTISEALAMNLPMVLYKPIPGQEQDNARFLLQAGVAKQADNLTNLIEQIANVLQSPDQLSEMIEHSKHLQKKDASLSAIEVIVKTRREYNPQSRGEQLVPSLQIL
jgi:processive 1,2-diacylglycerol beta-glucosyltransferase